MALNNWIVERYESSTMNFQKDVVNINYDDFGDCKNKLIAPLQPRSYGKIQDYQVLENSV